MSCELSECCSCYTTRSRSTDGTRIRIVPAIEFTEGARCEPNFGQVVLELWRVVGGVLHGGELSPFRCNVIVVGVV